MIVSFVPGIIQETPSQREVPDAALRLVKCRPTVT